MAEALWHARLAPQRAAEDVDGAELAGLLAWLSAAMAAAVAGRRGAMAAYRRGGRPCPRCATPIAVQGLGEWNRKAYWCPSCQR